MQQQYDNSFLQEDEIDLKELFLTIWNNKFKIAFFTFLVTSLTIVYTLSIPNSYESSTNLVPQTQAKPSLGGLGALAGMAGIDLGGSGDIDAATSFQTILEDYSFEEYMIEKYNLIDKFNLKKENLVFALNYDKVYNFFNNKKEVKEKQPLVEQKFNTYKKILGIIYYFI